MTLWSATRCVLSTLVVPSPVLSYYYPISSIFSTCMPQTRRTTHGTNKEAVDNIQNPPPPPKRIKLARTNADGLESKVPGDCMLWWYF